MSHSSSSFYRMLIMESWKYSFVIMAIICHKSFAEYFHPDGSGRFSLGNTTYEISVTKLDWIMANYACKVSGMSLVSIEDEDEDDFIRAYLKANHTSTPGEHIWTSGNDIHYEGQYYWDSTGWSLGPYYNWWANQPNAGPNQNCILFESDGDWQWNDSDCSMLHRFICEKLDPCVSCS